jgi:hypothetical protein
VILLRPGCSATATRPTHALLLAVLVCAVACIACGKKGPPLPPLLRVPQAPADFTAERRGTDVKLQFTVPGVNTDGTRPANIERLDILRFTGPATATDQELLKLGTKVASVPVKAPANPDATTEADEPAEEPELKDEGLDQGAPAQLEDTLDRDASRPVELPVTDKKVRKETAPSRPLLGPPALVTSTTYAIVGINTKGRTGPLSRRVLVPLVPPPAPPSETTIAYDENTITVSWKPSPTMAPIQDPAENGLLPGRTFGVDTPTFSYHVYDVSPSAVTPAGEGSAAQLSGQLRLTRMPVTATSYGDTRIEWGATRCYTVRTVESFGDVSLESDAPEPVCETLKDTFPPSAPKDLRAIATERAISLIWEPSGEKDVVGYLVFRGANAEALQQLTAEPVTATTFVDGVASGTRFSYAIRAVDQAGNIGPLSNSVEETAR